MSKKNTLPPFKALQAFEQVAYHGNIVKASENLNISPSAVSHQIATLEKILNKRLFHRTGRGIILTEIGKHYLETISGALHQLQVATTQIIERREREVLNIHSAPSFGLSYLLPRLQKFKELFPQYQINLNCSYEDVQFNLEQVDIDIRHGLFKWSNLNVIPIKSDLACILANPEYLKYRNIQSPQDIIHCDLILSESALVQWKHWFAHYANEHLADLNYAFSFDRSYMSYEAAKQGAGLILESCLLTESYVKEGSLQPVFGKQYTLPLSSHYIVYPYTHQQYQRVNYFVEWLMSELAESFKLLHQTSS